MNHDIVCSLGALSTLTSLKQKPATSISTSIARGAGWMVLFKLTERSIGLISTLVLARLLMPEDFGLVAMAMSLVAMTELMSAFGFDIVLIQRQDATRQHYDTAWTYNVIFGTAIALLLLILTMPAAEFFHDPRLLGVIPVLALGSFFLGFENIGVVAFRKELNFQREFRFLLSKKLVSFTVTMILAFTLRNFWALIGGTLASRLFGVGMSYALHPYRPRFCLAAGKDIFHFSKWLMINNVIFFLQNRATDFILGRTLGAHMLGVYNVAYEIATMPSSELVAPINRATLPGYSKVASDMPRLRDEFLRVIGMIALFIFPVAIGLASVAEPAVALLLGNKWLEAIPLVQIMSLYGLVNALQSNFGLVLVSLGKPRVVTLIAGVSLVLFLPSMVLMSRQFGVVAAAWTLFGFSILTTPFVHIAFFRQSGMEFLQYISRVWRPLVAAVIMGAGVYAFRATYMMIDTPQFIEIDLLGSVGLGILIYCLSLFSLWRLSGCPDGAEMFLLRNIKNQLCKWRGC